MIIPTISKGRTHILLMNCPLKELCIPTFTSIGQIIRMNMRTITRIDEQDRSLNAEGPTGCNCSRIVAEPGFRKGCYSYGDVGPISPEQEYELCSFIKHGGGLV